MSSKLKHPDNFIKENFIKLSVESLDKRNCEKDGTICITNVHSSNSVHMERQGLSKPHVNQAYGAMLSYEETPLGVCQSAVDRIIDTVYVDNVTMQCVPHRAIRLY